jgi:hypothetical protein
VAIVIKWISGSGDGVVSVYVVDVPVLVIIDLIVGDLQRVGPHVINEVGVTIEDAGVDDDGQK